MKQGIIYTIIFTLVCSFLFVFLLAFANEMTRPLTEKNQEISLRKAVLKVFNIPFSSDDQAYTLYADEIDIIERAGTELYFYKKADTNLYAIQFREMALWGQVWGIVAVNDDVTRISGVEFIRHNETPGLGGRIDEKAYKDQFRGELVGSDGLLKGTRKGQYDYNTENGEVDAISGATRTSERIEYIVNQQLILLRKLLAGE